VLCHSSAAAGVPERGRVRGWAIVNSCDDSEVVVMLSGTGVWGGELRGAVWCRRAPGAPLGLVELFCRVHNVFR